MVKTDKPDHEGPLVDRVVWTAGLARLKLTLADRAALAKDLEGVLEHVGVLQDVDTTGVEPFRPQVVAQDPWRSDVVEESLPRDQALKAAPAARDGQFWVPRIVSAEAGAEEVPDDARR
jgi:aspartyl-tRNA(Asn)/glutamyl-tRNA(Gln) amidotransferase subunit C